jgi:arylsulfatase A-like enzyme
MTIRIFWFIGFAAISQPVVAQSSTREAKKLPNIIYIYADDMGYAELGCYGQKKIRTPNLDRMARAGMRFTQHYTSTPVCAPARAMLMTGKHGGHSYIRGNFELGGFADSEERGQMPLPKEAFTVADLLKQKGYATAMIGKWGMGAAGTVGSPLKHGFDYYYGYLDQKQAHNYYPTHLWENDHWDTLGQPYFSVHRPPLDSLKATQADFDSFKGKEYAPAKMTEKALAFIDRNKAGRFFLYLPYTIPHVSLQVPDEWVEKYRGQFDEKPYYGKRGYAYHQYPRSAYAAMISYLDAQVGLVMEKLKQLGLEENTLVMFSSDNGTSFNGGVDAKFFNSVGKLRGLKMDVYEGGIRVPFIAKWPGRIPAGKTSDLVCVQYDLFATLADLTGQEVKKTDGISFLPELLGKPGEQQKHEYLYFEYAEKGGQLAIRMGNWKGVKTDLKMNPKAPWQLFDLRSDPGETTDISAQHRDVLKKFDAIVRKEHEDPGVKRWQFVEEVIKATGQ